MISTKNNASPVHDNAEGSDASNSNISSSEDSEENDMTSDVVDDEKYVEKIAHRETRYVTYLRLGLLLTLFVAASIVCTTVYLFVSGGENDEFEKAFDAYSTKLTETFQSIADRRLGAIASFSTTITSFALATNSSWPFVTVPNFEAQVRHIGKLANVENIAFAPIVSAEDRQEWENVYVPQEIFKWRAESLATNMLFDLPPNVSSAEFTVAGKDNYEGQPDFSKGYSKQIVESRYSPDGLKFYIVNGEGPFMPWWQTAPYQYGTNVGLINLDLDIDPTFDNNLIAILSKGKAGLGKVATSGYGNTDNPASGFYYPVLEGIADNSTAVGSLGTLIFWLPYFADILPQDAVGFVGVLRNTCNQSFTFRIDGSEVTFVGDGDLHDSKYNYLMHEVSFLELVNKSIESKDYLGLPIDADGCQYILTIYASADLEAEYKSNKPVLYTVVAMMIFLVTSLLFLLYDRLAHGNEINQKKLGLVTEGSKESRLQSFLNGENADIAGGSDEPIADNFPNCTVMFADIAGFTKWSATREPAQVFCLLQEVYREFDLIAKRLRVFKVETIGDCYMAVAGLPTPQPNHARLMARFANECLLQIRETTSRLADKLGEGTSDLTLRIGLHSGPVTAGILRGEKSRFQLFGDTVNTASRMESTGERNRIQVSDFTADLLSQAGKGHWLIPREDVVEAKGKGMLNTFWLVYERGRSTVSSLPKSLGTTTYDNDETEGIDVDCEKNVPTTRRNSVGELVSI
jgi:class 3 adenylate cyclase